MERVMLDPDPTLSVIETESPTDS